MRRLLLVLLALLVCAPAASAQDATPTPVPTEEADDGVLEPDEIPPEETVTPVGPCTSEGADADYQYCPQPGPLGEATGKGKPTAGSVTSVRPIAAQTLPRTGADPLLLALCGLGLLALGAGLRLRFRPAAPPPSA